MENSSCHYMHTIPFGFKQHPRLDEYDRNAARFLIAEHDAEVFLTQYNKATNTVGQPMRCTI